MWSSVGTLLVLSLFSCASHAIKWETCAPPSAPVSVQDVSMNPDPAISGANFTITLPAVTRERLEGGNVAVYVTYFGIPVYISNEDLCVHTACPVESGSFSFTNTQFLPSVTPTGWYVLWLKATAGRSGVLFCAKVSFRIEQSSLQLHPGKLGRFPHHAAAA